MVKKRSSLIQFEGDVNPRNMRLWKQFKNAKIAAGRSEGTLIGYESDLFQFFRFLNSECDDAIIPEITEEEIELFISRCKESGNNEKRIRRRLASLSSFFIYLKEKRKIKDNWVDYVKRPGLGEEINIRTFLTENQLLELKGKLKTHSDLGLRVYIELGLCTLAKSSEIARITWDKVDLDDRWIRNVRCRGSKIRTFRISEEVRDLLVEWKAMCRENGIQSEYVIFAKNNGVIIPVNSSILAVRVRKAFRLIGINRGFNHDLRYSMENILKDRGVSATFISKMLGYDDSDTVIDPYAIPDEDKFAADYDNIFN